MGVGVCGCVWVCGGVCVFIFVSLYLIPDQVKMIRDWQELHKDDGKGLEGSGSRRCGCLLY